MASWIKAAEDLFEVVDRKAKLVVNEMSEEQPELQPSAPRAQENQATRSKSKDKIQKRRTSTDFSKPTTSDHGQGSTETSLVNDRGDKNQDASREISPNTSILMKDASSEPVSYIDKDSVKSSPKNKDLAKRKDSSLKRKVKTKDLSSDALQKDIETDQSDNSPAATENNIEIVASINDDSKYEVSKGDNEITSTLVVAGMDDGAINGGNSAITNAEANQAPSDPCIQVEEITGSQRVVEAKSINSAKASDSGPAAGPSSSLDQNNEHRHNASPVRVQEQLDEAQGLLKVAISTGQSKEARLARVCAGLSSRLQEYKTENAQLEELLCAERELSTSYQSHIKQLEKELSTRKAELTRIESNFADALVAKNCEIESLANALDTLKKQAAASEENLSSLQENMDTILRSRELTETRMMQALREELAAAEHRAEEERAAHGATKMAAVEREVELEHRAVEASNALARIQRSADESISRAIELEHKIALLEVESASLNQELQEMEACARRERRKSSEEANQILQIQAWQEEVERARQSQRDAEGKLSSLEAEVQKMRVEMAGMKREAEHYSRHEHMELEKRYRELTDLLYHKQTQLETMASEKAAAEFQLEKEVRRLQEAQLDAERNRSSRRALSSWEEDSDFKVLESLPLHHRHMAAASKQLEKAAKLLDSGAVRATRFLWRYPYARVVFLFYLVFVHLFLMYLLHRLQEQADTISSKEIASSMGLNNSSLP